MIEHRFIISLFLLLTNITYSEARIGTSIIIVDNHDRIAECKKARVGSIIKTTGYYKSGDEGDAEYIVVPDDGFYIIDGNYVIKLKNGLLAKMNAKEGYINIKSFGCKTLEEDSQYDNTEIFQTVVNLATSYSYAVFVPVGDFLINGTIYLPYATKIIGYHGYTFRKSSRLVQTVQPVKGDSIVMFRGANNEGLRHVLVEGVTFLRDRTKEERAIYNNGEGYGLKSTVFGPSTELSLTNCGFIGWGHCFESAAILFSVRSDFAYCDNILYSRTGHSSSVVIQDANIWCCGHLVRISNYACSSITFSNCWMEGLQSLLLADNSARMENLNFSGCTISPLDYGANKSLIQYPKEVKWNVASISFSQCLLRVPGRIASDISQMSYKVSFTDCSVHYFGDGEKISFEGNSFFWEADNDKRTNKISLKGAK